MKMYLAIFILLFSCSQENPKAITSSKEKELLTYLTETYKEIDSTVKVDSFIFVRLDTLTLRDKYYNLISKYSDQMQTNTELIRLESAAVESYAQLMSLYSGLSEKLSQNYKQDAQEHLDSATAIQKRGIGIAEKINYYDSLYKIADTVNPIGFEAICFYQIRRKDQSVKKDTAFILLNVDKNIVDKSDFYKE